MAGRHSIPSIPIPPLLPLRGYCLSEDTTPQICWNSCLNNCSSQILSKKKKKKNLKFTGLDFSEVWTGWQSFHMLNVHEQVWKSSNFQGGMVPPGCSWRAWEFRLDACAGSEQSRTLPLLWEPGHSWAAGTTCWSAGQRSSGLCSAI